MQLETVVEPMVITPDRRIRVFISSTLHELAAEREAVRAAIEAMHLTPVMFELGARPHPPRSLYRAYLRQSDVFVGIYGKRYGWVAPGESISGLEDEYVLSAGMPRLLYVQASPDGRDPALDDLLLRIQHDDAASYRLFDTPDELRALVADDLAVLLTERFTLRDNAWTDAHRPTNNLPAQLSSFVGREVESERLVDAVRQSRLVTLTGVGGSGKTRLALHVAHSLFDEFPGGVWLAELSAVTRPEGIAAAVLAALKLRQQPGRSALQAVVDAVADTATLIILDNCEHLLTGCAQFAVALLEQCAGARVLATSREGLGVRGEMIVALPSLPIPPGTDASSLATIADVPSVRLFIDRARAVRPDFTVTDAEAPALVRLVRRLDGIPLALELAAARVMALTIHQIEERLDDRLRLLAGGSALVPRQQTLTATMDWSYDLLSDDEQALLRRLSVFADSFDLHAVERVCPLNDVSPDDIPDIVIRLVGKSLVAVVPGRTENRYRLLETIRQYAHGRLTDAGEAAVVRDAHRDHYLRLAEAANAKDPRTGQVEHLARLATDASNVYAALEWAHAAGDVSTVVRITVAMSWFWYIGGHWSQARDWLICVDEMAGGDPALRGRAAAWAAVFAWRRGETATAAARAATSLDAVGPEGDAETRGLSLLVLGVVAMAALRHADADRDCRAALEAFEAVGNTWGSSIALLLLAQLALTRQDPVADDLLNKADRLLADTDDLWARAVLTTLVGYQAFVTGDLDLSEQLYRDSAALTQQVGDRSWEGQDWLALGHIRMLRGDMDAARQELVQARRITEALGDSHETAHVSEAEALTAIADGDVQTGLRLFELAEDAAQRLDHGGGMGVQALRLAGVYRAYGRVRQAAALAHHSLTLLQRHGDHEHTAAAVAFISDLAGAADGLATTDAHEALAVARRLMDPVRD